MIDSDYGTSSAIHYTSRVAFDCVHSEKKRQAGRWKGSLKERELHLGAGKYEYALAALHERTQSKLHANCYRQSEHPAELVGKSVCAVVSEIEKVNMTACLEIATRV